MHFFRGRLLLVIGFLSLLTCQGCRECDPISVPDSTVILSVLDRRTGSAADIDFTHIYGINGTFVGDSIKEVGSSSYPLPLNTNDNRVSFVFETTGFTDTLHLKYNEVVEINGPDCGVYEAFSGLKALTGTELQDEVTEIKFGRNDLFDSLSIVSDGTERDTLNASINLYVNLCSSDMTPNRELAVFFYDQGGIPVATVFESIYNINNQARPIISAADGSVASVALPLNATSPTTFVFKESDTQSDTLIVTYNNSTIISDDQAGCIFTKGVGGLKLVDRTGANVDNRVDFPDATLNKSLFDSAAIFRNIVNSDNSIPNVNIFFK
ncbi:hypothetical protein V6R21_28250 [Limibacter armeniacum]|uniref:hypothetical protein n=1 Tax=Limibacter armeniacum TaxID=466084 RepID=UPI002FE50EED